jgi:hypothetical protein
VLRCDPRADRLARSGVYELHVRTSMPRSMCMLLGTL